MAECFLELNVADRTGLDLNRHPQPNFHTPAERGGVTQTLHTNQLKLRRYIARLQGAIILCSVFLYVLCFWVLSVVVVVVVFFHFSLILAITKDVNTEKQHTTLKITCKRFKEKRNLDKEEV